MIKQEICRNCGAQLEEIVPGKYRCPCCGSSFETEFSSEEEFMALNDASRKLRDGEFDEADKAYRGIIAKFPHSYESYFGRALCKHGITFVDDIKKGRKIPTCYITDVGSFIDDQNYKKAIEFAPKEVAEEYKKQAQLIENIISEWKEKASKQSYDVFISYKDKDDNNERTPDSYEAESLYNYLTQQGFKVFFSRQVLKEYVSERYEPYIFNAINVAPVMIVYGQKGEYMESTWVRNEWSRFVKKIELNEKERSGLIVAFEKMNGSDLPIEFKSIQCMDASEKTFLTDLVKNINNVLEKSRKPRNTINSAQTVFGKVGKKTKQMNYQEIRTFEIGKGSIEKITETDENIWENAQQFFKRKLYKLAKEQTNKFLENNEYHYGANELSLLIDSNYETIENYIADIKNKEQGEKIKYLITLGDKETAIHLVDCLLKRFNTAMEQDDALMFDIFALLLDLDFEQNKEMRKSMVNYLTMPPVKFSNRFDDYIKYIDNTDISYHIKSRLDLIHFDLVNKRPDIDSFKYINEIKEIDEGNTKNLLYELYATLDITPNFKDNIATILKYDRTAFFERLVNIFKYCETKNSIIKIIFDICNPLVKYISYDISPNELLKVREFFDELIKYIPDENDKIEEALRLMVDKLYKNELYELCLEYCALLLNYTSKKDEIVFIALLCKIECPNFNAGDEAKYSIKLDENLDEVKLLLHNKSEYAEEVYKIFKLQEEMASLHSLIKNEDMEAKQKIKKIKSLSEAKAEKKKQHGFFAKWFFRNPFAIFMITIIGLAAFVGFTYMYVNVNFSLNTLYSK